MMTHIKDTYSSCECGRTERAAVMLISLWLKIFSAKLSLSPFGWLVHGLKHERVFASPSLAVIKL